jgi:predicted permease
MSRVAPVPESPEDAAVRSRSGRIYGALLRLYPPAFRERFAASMRFAFATEAHEARRRGRLAFARFWCRSLRHLVAFGLAERVARRRPGGAWRRGLGDDLAHAARRLRRCPGFAVATVVTLALGIGASTAIFSLVYGVVLNPLSYPDADRLVAIQHSAEGAGLPQLGVSLGTYVHYREYNEAFEEITVFTPTYLAVLGDGGAQRVPGAMVSQGFFEIFLDGPPALGRVISEADQVPGAPRVAMIGEELWRTRYGADPGIIGRSISVEGAPVEVIGVLPATFDVPSSATQVWVAQQIDPEQVILGGFGRYGVGRLKPGVTGEQAWAELQRLIPTMAERFNPVAFDLLVTGGGLAAIVTPLKETVVGDVEQMLWILLGTVLFVLGVVCANVANLFLVRAESQRREIAVRAALGAGRAQIVRHHLAESLLLGAVGGTAGVLLALLGLRWVAAWGSSTIPRLHEVGIHLPVLAFAAAISLGASLTFGLIPTVRHRGAALAGTMSDGGRGATLGRKRHRARNALVVAQISLAVVLLVGAGLMVRTFRHLRGVEPGFDAGSSLVFRVGLPEALYPGRVEAMQFQQRVLERVSQLPGVSAVGATRCLPLDGCDNRTPVYAEGIPFEPGETPPSVDVRGATSGFFRAMGIPLIEGRAFEPADPGRRPAAAVVSVNVAERLWPGESAVGKRIYPDVPEEDPYTVVGVVGNVISYGLAEPPPEILWVSFLGPYGYVAPPHAMTFVVRTEVPPLSLAPALRAALQELDANVPLSDLRTMREVVEQASAPTEFAMLLLVAAGGVALALGAVGVYGVLSYVVSQRTGEIGVRIALGAVAGDVSRMILRQGAAVAAVGVILGLAGALALTQLMEAVLFGVSPVDPLTYAAVALGLVLIALLASYLPARRAASVDPVDALRSG